jgi:hypothetical protein
MAHPWTLVDKRGEEGYGSQQGMVLQLGLKCRVSHYSLQNVVCLKPTRTPENWMGSLKVLK